MLLILGGNPVYNAPAELRLREQIVKGPVRRPSGTVRRRDERIVPVASAGSALFWKRGATFAPTTARPIIQPIIAPLYDGKSAHEVISGLVEEPRDGYAIVSDYWARQGNSGPVRLQQTAARRRRREHRRRAQDVRSTAGMRLPRFRRLRLVTPWPDAIEVTLRPDPCIWDGRHSNNGWLQELPKPFVKLTWDNAAYMSPDTAAKAPHHGRYRLRAPLRHHRSWRSRTSGRRRALRKSAGHHSAGRTRRHRQPVPGLWTDAGGQSGQPTSATTPTTCSRSALALAVRLQNPRAHRDKYPLAVTTHHQTMEGRDIIRVSSIAQFQRHPSMAPEENEHGKDRRRRAYENDP